ncbi:TM2 domain-containing membrane protein YozV [Arthrobacter ginsengisoli]|uniref:TM2 domain-containing membrane protein YozV n=1 Tax=Arthrobacter ginsengisoli TaxID=1356565 RepID=A0ABU1U798_9MICC|nr:TM2 domain-containing protein [Arthrobacter ginsengisoli]MDR7081067.1 TM2 domain-containing membrane protein YozV [Arthrobacter ginsengisoli]
MTQPYPDPNAVPPEGYDQPPAAPYQGQQYPSGPQPQQPQYQQQGYAAGPQQPYAGQPQYQAHPPAPQQYQAYPPAPQQPMYQQQPPVPNPVYGYPQPKSKIVAGLLGIFLGGLGIHRFYLGFTKIAVIQLILTLVLGAVTFGIVALWGVIEGIMIIAGSAYFRADANGVPLRD